ncbi:DUF2490 domain-containing protein [Mucilaginibacter rubeus]|uniref:DUF2490 domain-containing protein n=1 Tax=Mucilaginibacter rubeus TaxID=2027860 RepID=UPI00166612C8|nr:DUF2490 domain-containing protein [Mucilaginibacter rubeus]
MSRAGGHYFNPAFLRTLGASFDAQFRSADQYDYLRNILLRPSVNYYFANNKIAALGYAYAANNGRNADGAPTFRPESRIWEQFIVNQKLGKATILQHRLRLEQRFVGNTTLRNDQYFAQRFRYFARAVISLRHDTLFTQGPFISLQNEVFINARNKSKVNGRIFDQNRAYVAIGYRLSKKMGIEKGYLNQYIRHRDS